MFWKNNLPEDHEISLCLEKAAAPNGALWYSWITSSPTKNHTGDVDQRPRLFTFTNDLKSPQSSHDDNSMSRMLLEDETWLEDTVKAVASGSRLFLTTTGHLGLGPEMMRPGDMIYILDGGLMPHVLRNRPQKRGVTMVGTCYIEGLMHWGSELGNYADNAKDIEGLEHKLRRQLEDLSISREELLLY